jgi:deazaflavin-dependent oxidoreductase (nitroreductase family)
MTRYLSRAHTIVYRITRGRFGGNLRVGAGFRKPAPTLLLEHVGRKSGKRFTSPVLYITDGPNVIVVASAAGRDEHPQWYRNLLAHPDTHIEIGADRRAVTAVQADPDERARLWPFTGAGLRRFRLVPELEPRDSGHRSPTALTDVTVRRYRTPGQPAAATPTPTPPPPPLPIATTALYNPANYQNFAVVNDGVIFFFDQGVLLPASYGAVQVLAPRSAIDPMIA